MSVPLTYNQRGLHLEVQSHADLPHLVPGGAPVLAPVLRPRVLHHQHVCHGVQPRPVAHRLKEVAVDVEPTGTQWVNCYHDGQQLMK